MKIVAIDFETADPGRDSACAVGIVVVENGRITDAAYRLIRPPRREFAFTHIHGIDWGTVAHQPEFSLVWDSLSSLFKGASYIAAHNASFDRSVLNACCAASGKTAPRAPFICTVKLARAVWNIYPTKLPNVCKHLGIPLIHHSAESDAFACASIMATAIAAGHSLDQARLK